MRICLLTTQDLDADPFPADDWPCDPRPFLKEAEWDVVVLDKRTSVARVTALAQDGYDLFFNLCDGAADENRPGIEVVETLERLRVPFTGATSEFYEPSREAMKRACETRGIATPAWVLARDAADVERAAETLRFPLFVKHYSSYASVALSRRSRVRTPAGLRRQARKIMSRYGAALIEEYVDGVECTVLVAENPDDPQRPTTYTPMQYRFPEGEHFKHADMKWVDFNALASFPVEEPELDARLRDVSARFFVALEGASFGRCDLRVDGNGTPFMLEINPNCGVYYPPSDPGSADLCLARDPAGHEGFTRQMVRAALERHRRLMAKEGGQDMADVTVKKIDEMETVYEGVFVRARASMGIKSFGMQIMNMPPGFEQYPEHDEAGTGQEEVYTALSGSARLIVGDDEYKLEPGVFARVGAAEKRRIIPGPEGMQLLSLGGVPGKAYEPPEWSELGAGLPTGEES